MKSGDKLKVRIRPKENEGFYILKGLVSVYRIAPA